MEEILARLAGVSGIFLFLDYDGTLMPIMPTPDEARPSARLVAVLEKLTEQTIFRVAIISGRRLVELQSFFPLRSLYLAGSHGAEQLIPGRGRITVSIPQDARIMLRNLVKRISEILPENSGFILEDKEIALALHYRLVSSALAEQVVARFCRLCQEELSGSYWRILKGKKVIEVRLSYADKGKTVEAFLTTWPDAMPVYIGDDTTDEDAFLVIKEKGVGILVSEHPRQTAATARLKDSDEVISFLELLTSYQQSAFSF